jgi:hypothetical protein
MDRHLLLSKCLAVGIILLFVGVAVTPSINFTVVKASNNDLVVATTQACGIKGYGNTTVKLTREQYQNLDQYLVAFRERLNQTSTREEAVPIFKEAIVELDKYGLLPKGMDAEQAQKIVTRSAYGSHIPLLLTQILSSHRSLIDSNFNVVCLLAGKTNFTCFQSIGSVLLDKIGEFLYNNFYMKNLLLLIGFLWVQLVWISNINPFCLTNRFYLGYRNLYNPDYFLMSSGWITTIGLQGIKRIQGDMIGSLPVEHFYFSGGPFPANEYYPAVLGFLGIKIRLTYDNDLLNKFFYLGSALCVNISSEPPSNYRIMD